MAGNNTSTRKKASAGFFAAVMVVSMMAIGGAAFAGTASADAATFDSVDVSASTPETGATGNTITIDADTSGGTDDIQRAKIDFTSGDNNAWETDNGDLFPDGLTTSDVTVKVDTTGDGNFDVNTNPTSVQENSPGNIQFDLGSASTVADDANNGDIEIEISGVTLPDTVGNYDPTITIDPDAVGSVDGTDNSFALTQTPDLTVTDTNDATSGPEITSVTKSGSSQLTIEFSEGVTDQDDVALDMGDLTYVDNNGNDAGSITGVTHTPGSSTLTATTDNVITTQDVGTDSVFATTNVQDVDDNQAPQDEVTVQPTALSGGGNGAVSYDIGTSATQNIVAGSADQELNQVRIQDQSGGEFSGLLTISMPDGVSVNESASNLNLNTVTTLDGTVNIDSVDVVNSGNDIEVDLSGTSSAGERIRIKSGALHVSTDATTFDTGSATSGTTSLNVQVEHFSGTLNTDGDTSSNGLVTATSPTTGNPGSSGEALSINSNGQNLDDRLQISGIDQNEIGADTDLVLTVDGTGITFDQNVDLTTVIGASDGTQDDLDIDGDGTDELDVANASITDTTLTVPVNNTITNNNGFPYTVAFRTSDTDSGEGVRFNASGSASGAADLNVTVESASPSTGSYQLGATDSPTFNDRINGINSPGLSFSSDDTIAIGANNQDPANDLTVDLSTPVQENSYLNITTNNTDVTFDTSTDVSASDLSYGGDIGSGNINNVTVESDVIALGLGTETSENDGDFGGSGSDSITVGLNSENKFSLNVSNAPADNTKVQFNATNDPVQFVDSTNVLDLERPDATFNGGSNATVDVDNDGEQQVIDDGDQETLVITSDDISGQISDATNITVTLESDTGVTFDQSATTNLDSGANDNDEIDVFGDEDGNYNDGDDDIFDADGDADGAFNVITVNANSIELELDDDTSGASGPDTFVDSDHAIVIDEIPLNATSDASNTTISVTTNTSDSEVTSELGNIVVTNEVSPTEIYGDADVSDTDGNGGQGPSGYYGDSASTSSDHQLAVDSSVDSSVYVTDGTLDFGGAAVDLTVVSQPTDESYAASDLLNTTSLETASDGTDDFQFTAPADATTGNYVINASTSEGGVNMTYDVTAGSAQQLNVTKVKDGIAGGNGDTGEAIYRVQVEDAGGNLVQDADISFSTILSGDAQRASGSQGGTFYENYSVSDGTVTEADGDAFSNEGSSLVSYDASNDQAANTPGEFYVSLSDTTEESVSLEVRPDSSSISGGSASAEFYTIRNVNVELNTSSTTTFANTPVGVTVTAGNGNGETVTVPRLGPTVNSGNTTVATIGDSGPTTNNSGVATTTATAQAEGTASVEAVLNNKLGTSELTVDDPDYGITDVTLDPSTVTENQTVAHDLTYTVTAASNDGNSDTYTVTLPNTTSFEGVNSLNVTDADGDEISISSSASLADANGGTDNQVTFGIQPDSTFDTSAVNVDANVSVNFPAVEETTEGDVVLDVTDSSSGDTNATTGITIEPEDVEPAPTATVTFDNQTVTNGSDTVTVDSANLSEGGFVAIHSVPVTPENGSAVDTVVGVSEYLGNGTSEDITVTLDEPLTENTSLVAMPHQDTNGNETYDFVTSDGSADGPYVADGSAVTDTASITVQEVPTDPTERALQIVGKEDPANFTQDDVTTVITQFNRDRTVNGVDIQQDDVSSVITLFERN